MARTLLWNLFKNLNGLQSYVINTDKWELIILRKKNSADRHIFTTSLKWEIFGKSFSDSQSSEVFDDILFD